MNRELQVTHLRRMLKKHRKYLLQYWTERVIRQLPSDLNTFQEAEFVYGQPVHVFIFNHADQAFNILFGSKLVILESNSKF